MGAPHKASQLSHSGVWGTIGYASSTNHDGGGETGLHNGSAAVDGKSGKSQTAERVESSQLKTELIQGLMGNSTHQ